MTSILLQDLRFASRMLVKNPAFTTIAVVTLALAIGANSAIFSLINTAIFGPLPFEDADRLVRVFRQSRDGGEIHFFSYPDYVEYRDRCDAFDELAAGAFMPLSVGTGDTNERRFGQIVTGNYFAALRAEALYGRMLTAEDDRTPGGHPVVVLSHRYWQRAYGGRPDVVGETITLSGYPFTIVGVAPKGFTGAMPIPSPELWVPMMMLAQIRPDSRDQLTERESSFLWVLGRLKPGLSMPQAQARLGVTASQLKEVDPERYEDEYAIIVPSEGIIPMTPGMRRTALAVSALVMSMVALVLSVGCANVANLLLARSTARRREIGIRLAIGASRWRVVRQLLTESVLLALLGGVVGLLVATWTLHVLPASLPELPMGITLELDIGLDRRVLGFTALVSVLTGVLFGLVPALAVTRVDLAPSLKDDAAASGLGTKRSRLNSVLVVGQVATSLVLLISAGLFVRSLMFAHAVDPGFDHDNVLAVMMDFGAHDYDEASTKSFNEQFVERARALPGVVSASIEDCPPLTMTMSSRNFWVEGRPFSDPDDEQVNVANSTISAGNFKTLGIPLLRGRDFNEQDVADAPGVAVVNEAFVNRYWPGQDPLGKRISTEGSEGPYLEVVGVAATVKYRLIGEEPRPYVYLALSQNYEAPFETLLLRTTGGPATVLRAVRELIRDLDPNISPMDARPLTSLVSFALLPAKFAAGLFGLLGVLALLLASTGLYGVMSYTVGQRTHEIGVRVALGAQRADVVYLVLRQGLILTTIGVGIGLLVSLAGTRMLSTLLYDISATDPVTFIGVSLLLTTVALLACYIPARRATKVDPMVALRYE